MASRVKPPSHDDGTFNSLATLANLPLRKNFGHRFVGQRFGAASKPRVLSADERIAIEQRLRQEDRL
jgi:hypothetical protein